MPVLDNPQSDLPPPPDTGQQGAAPDQEAELASAPDSVGQQETTDVDADLPDVVTTEPAITLEQPNVSNDHRRNRLLVGGGVVLGAFVLAAGSYMLPAKNHADKVVGTVTSELTIPGNTVPGNGKPTVSASNTPESTVPPVSPHGSIETAKILPGEKTLTVERPNAPSIEVPALLRSPDDGVPSAVSAASDLMACYITTGDERCLNAFSTFEQPISTLNNIRDQIMQPYLDLKIPYAQFVIRDAPETAAQFTINTTADGSVKVTLVGGKMGASVNDSHDWQGQKPTANWGRPVDYDFTVLEFTFVKTGDILQISHIDANLQRTSQ